MHRAYTSILPTSNRLLQQRWDSTYYEEHRRKVKEAAPMVDTRAPPTYMHLHLKLKKLQLEEERLAMIERDNRILLEKMSYIMRTRGRIDNRNNYEYKSLNREKRQRELLRVTEENQAILHRITLRNAEYSAEQLQLDWEENQRFMDSISRFPKDWWKKEERRGASRTSRRSNRQKHNKDEDDSQKSDTQNDEKDDEKKEDEEEKDENTKDTKNTKDSKNKKDNKNKKSAKKGSKDSKKGDNSKDEETKKGDNSKEDGTTKDNEDDNAKETKDTKQKETVKG